MRVLIAPDKFKGTATATEVADAIASVLGSAGHETVTQPLADGGDGTLEAFGGANRTSTVTGPLGDPIDAEWRYGSGRTAVIEMARASGLAAVGGAENNDAVAATTAGTGELIVQAIERGARHVIVGVGGSATTDGGLGALEAMHPLQRLREIEIEVACDVTTRFVDAAAVFGPQKGATPAQVELLTRRLERLAQVYRQERGVDVTGLDRAGAAGGLAGGLASVGARLVDGFGLVAEAVGLDESIADVDLVITGEGQLDATSFDGKVVGGVLDLAREVGVPVIAVVGRVAAGLESSIPVVSLVDVAGEERALASPVAAITDAAERILDVAEAATSPPAGL
ncbi:MAG: glycerate kinase [Actinomycetota bacterium]